MKRPGFSLLETVIALAVAVLLLGASVAGRTYLLQNAQINQQQTIMTTLANDSIEKARLTRSAYKTDLFDGFGDSANEPAVNTTAYLIPHTVQFNADLSAQLSWCAYVPSKPAYTQPAGCDSLSAAVGIFGSTPTFASLIKAGKQAEIVAVAKTATSHSNNFQIIDTANYDDASNSAKSPSAQVVVGSGDDANYNYYYRQISVVKKCSAATTSIVNKNYQYYAFTVSVWPYLSNQASGISRTVTFADQGVNAFC
jgi:Tfp pilus assembly protein PilV